MRVLTIGNLYPPHHFGGYEQVWESAVGHLRGQGAEVRVLAADYRHPGRPDGDEPDVERTLRWYWSDHQFARMPLRQRLEVERHNHRELDRALGALRPDVVGFWSMGGMSHSLVESVRRRRLPMVAFVHDGWLDYGRGADQWTRMFAARRYRPAAPVVQALTGLPTRVSYGDAGRYVFVSEFLRDKALGLGLGLTDVAIAHSGIAPRFRAASAAPAWEWRLLHVGRLHPDKGIADAVRCLTQLPAQATLTFAGSWDPRDESALARLVGELEVAPRVTMLGHQAPERVAELYRRCDAVLFPVRWDEPWGLVPLEAMGCGCPVIATGRGGSREYLRDGENCLLAAPEDPAALAAAVRRLAEEPELRHRLRAGGLATAAAHTEGLFNAQVERHLTEVAGEPAGATRAARPVTAVS
jgi:glycosyltransferase involved in cell wall biosynthesis